MRMMLENCANSTAISCDVPTVLLHHKLMIDERLLLTGCCSLPPWHDRGNMRKTFWIQTTVKSTRSPRVSRLGSLIRKTDLLLAFITIHSSPPVIREWSTSQWGLFMPINVKLECGKSRSRSLMLLLVQISRRRPVLPRHCRARPEGEEKSSTVAVRKLTLDEKMENKSSGNRLFASCTQLITTARLMDTSIKERKCRGLFVPAKQTWINSLPKAHAHAHTHRDFAQSRKHHNSHF